MIGAIACVVFLVLLTAFVVGGMASMLLIDHGCECSKCNLRPERGTDG